MLVLSNIEVVYSEVILVLKGVSLEIREGSITALLGANGAGKSTTCKAISGLLNSENGRVTHGNIEFKGRRIDNMNPEHIVNAGIIQVMEGHRVFPYLTVHENLMMGAYTRRDSKNDIKRDLEMVYEYYPVIARLHKQKAGYLSGGEQQMLVIGRGLMARPDLILLDEASLGLSPILVDEIFEIIRRINREEKMTILIVEQNAMVALSIADWGYVMENGRIVLEGSGEKLMENPDVKEFYLGMNEMGGRKSYKDVKHYRRRKRWLT
ncbi:MAG: ABC transporter ATP-binding protein [Deltaproteobacteria bacterium]|nr:ABC transporter ATP-binding protein [Deltaproteobacteria bacterium]